MATKEFVLEQLKSLPPERGLLIKGNKAWIRCPMHADGKEKSPSLCVSLGDGRSEPGDWSCFGCNGNQDLEDGGKWQSLAKLLNIPAA